MIESLALADPSTWLALLTRAALEIVLGVDNIVFIAIMANRVRAEERARAYQLGLLGALVTRLALLGALSWILGLTKPLFTLADHPIAVRDLILIAGGVFLIGKAAHEMYYAMEVHGADAPDLAKRSSLVSVVLQIMVVDIVFSLDSVITAVGMAEQLWVMATAMIVAVLVMLLFARRIGEFVNRHPSMRVLALSFLLLIGVLLTAEGFGQHVDKGYIYFAMGFSLLVELVNMRVRGQRPPPQPSADA